MRFNSRWLMAIRILVALLPLACQRQPAKVPPAKIEKLQGTEVSRVTLTERAEQRLGIETGAVQVPPAEQKSAKPGRGARVEAGAAVRVVVPYDAVIHDVRGKAWVYTNPAPQTYVRHQVFPRDAVAQSSSYSYSYVRQQGESSHDAMDR